MAEHRVTLIPGDGTGPELVDAARRVLEATGVSLAWDLQPAGEEVARREGQPIPARVLDSIRRTGVALKGPITTPLPSPGRSANIDLRIALDLYASVRPCRSLLGVRSRYRGVDLVVIRENTEDLYAGIELEQGRPETGALLDFIARATGQTIRQDSGVSIKSITVRGSERIARFGFAYARANGRRSLTVGHKANIMKVSDGLFVETARRVAAEFPDVEYRERIVDNLAMQLVQRPEQFDVLLLPNLYGDIVSDLCAGLIGGLGMAPGAHVGEAAAVFEPTHGSAPKYRGRNLVNPVAMILSGAMLLRHLGELEAAARVEAAVASVVEEGRSVTYDLKPTREDPTAVGTSEVADAVIARLAG